MQYFKFFKANSPIIFLSLLLLKDLILGASFSDAAIIAVIASLTAYYHFLEDKEEPVNEQFKKDLTALRESVKQNKDQMEALKLSSSFVRR